MTPTRVLLQNPWVAPYRLAVFDAIRSRPELDVTFAVGKPLGEADASQDLASRGARIIDVGNQFPFRRGTRSLITLQGGLLAQVDRKRFDVMIASFDPRMVMNLLAMRKARRLGIPFIWWGHGVRPRGRFASFYKRLVDKASAVIVYDGEGKERLVRLGVSPNKVFVAWNSVDTAEIARLRQPYHADDRSDVLYIGRLVASKKVDLLLRGFSLFAASGMSPEVRLTVLGSGPEETALKSLAESLGIAQNTEFIPGMYEQSQIAPYFNRSVVHACGGYVGLSVIQSLAFGVPVVAPSGEPHSPEIAALEDRVNSRFFARDSADDLAQVLTDCFADRAGLDRQSAAGIKKVSGQFSVEAMAATFVEAVDFVKGCAV